MVMGGGKGCWFCPQEPAPAPATARHAPRALSNPVPQPSKHPRGTEDEAEQGRSTQGAFPVLCQVFSSCFAVPELAARCTSPRQGWCNGEKSRACASAAASHHISTTSFYQLLF